MTDDRTTLQAFISNAKAGHVLPEWTLTSFHAADGTVYVPAAIGSDDELAALLLAASEGQRSVRHLRHVYLPACWLRDQYPREADVISRIVDDTRRAAAAN